MAAGSSWLPQEDGLRKICGLLEQQISPSSADKSQVWQELQQYSQFPDFNNYLVFILARAEVFAHALPSFSGEKLDLFSCLVGNLGV